jgi:two-component system response regulator AtoC
VIEIVAHSETMREAVRLADRVAATDANVLVTGESGVGKDAIAFYIHGKSNRAAQSFVKIDCATLPSGLLEAELFGYERGAFTGASEGKPGRLEASHRGTLVLDEIAYLTNDSQAKLLRVIETREFERLGGRRTIKVDARLMALTNVDLSDAVKRQHFREDLYYRLNVVHIKVPSLRERPEDLAELARTFVKAYATKHGREVSALSPEALSLLSEYDHLPESMRAAVSVQRRREKPQSLAEVEAQYVAEILVQTKGNKTEAARILGISRKNLYEKLARKSKDEEGKTTKDEG